MLEPLGEAPFRRGPIIDASAVIYANLIHRGLAIASANPVSADDIAMQGNGRDIALTIDRATRVPQGFRYILRFQDQPDFTRLRSLELRAGNAHGCVILPPDGMVGQIERIIGGRCTGWIIDIEHERRRYLDAVVTVDGTPVPVSFVKRADMAAIAPQDAGSAFTFELPDWAREGGEHRVAIQIGSRTLSTVVYTEQNSALYAPAEFPRPTPRGPPDDARGMALSDASPGATGATLHLGSGAVAAAGAPRLNLTIDGLKLGLLPLPLMPSDDAPVAVPIAIQHQPLRILAALAAPAPLPLLLEARAPYAESARLEMSLPAPAMPVRPLSALRDAIGLIDAACLGSHALRLTFLVSERSLLVAQLLPEGLRLCTVEATSMQGGPHFAQITLLSPYAPLLIVCRDADGMIRGMDILPFPSLCRGGLHSAERRAFADGGDDIDALVRLSGAILDGLLRRREGPPLSIAVMTAGAAGNEVILSPDFGEWLRWTMNAQLLLLADQRQEGIADLVLGVHAAPSLSALSCATDPAAALQSAPFSLSPPPGDTGPVWLGSMPSSRGWLDQLQPDAVRGWYPRMRGAPLPDGGGAWPGPAGIAAVGFARRAPSLATELLFPSGTGDATAAALKPLSITLCIGLEADDGTPRLLLESLAMQDGAAQMRCVVAVAGTPPAELVAMLESTFPDRHDIVLCDATLRRPLLVRAAAGSRGDILLIVAPTVILHDPTTAQRLARATLEQGAGTVGCAMVGGGGAKLALVSEGYELLSLAVGSTPAVRFRPTTLRLAPAGATTPVLANSSALMAIRSGLYAEIATPLHGPGDDAADVALGLRAIAAGSVNLCMSSVSAFTTVAPRPGHLDIDVLRHLPKLALGTLADAVCAWRLLA